MNVFTNIAERGEACNSAHNVSAMPNYRLAWSGYDVLGTPRVAAILLPFPELVNIFHPPPLSTNDEESFVVDPQVDDLDSLDVVEHLVYEPVRVLTPLASRPWTLTSLCRCSTVIEVDARSAFLFGVSAQLKEQYACLTTVTI